jgi:predicted Zn finger-like uncharacterized protein
MYTSCPECGTVFRISTTDLRAAEGVVRCGHCSATFNAVATLSDEPPPTVTLRQLALPTEPEPPSEPAAGDLVESGLPAASDDTLEFDIPEDGWTNFFEAAPATPPPPATAGEDESADELPEAALAADAPDEPVPLTGLEADVGTGLGSDTVDQAGLYRALAAEPGGLNPEDGAWWEGLLEEVQDEGDRPEAVYVIGEEESAPAPVPEPDQEPATEPEPEPDPQPDLEPAWDDAVLDDTRSPEPLPADFAADLAPAAGVAGALPGVDSPEPVREREPRVADRPFAWEPPPPPPAEPRRHWAYAAGSLLLALLLVIQLIHLQRDSLATSPDLFEPLQRLYGALGLTLMPAWDLKSYEVRGSEAVTDRSSPGALDILARIAVVGRDRVGLPLVRVTLRDRFGKPLGTRVFQPAEYLGRTPRPREPVSPGTLIPVEVSLKDPGTAAQGFDVDVCVMNRRDGILCRAEREPFVR